MYTTEEYFNAWLMYLAGAALLIACWWFLSSLFPWRELRQISRILVAVLLLVPWYTDTTYTYLAPAAIVAIVESLTLGAPAFWRAGTPLLVCTAICVALSLGWSIWRWRKHSVSESTS